MGLTAAKQDLIDKEHELLRLQAEWELIESEAEARRTRAAGLELAEVEESALKPVQRRGKARVASEMEGQNLADLSASELQRLAAADAKLVTELATKSKNLKGTFQRFLKDAARSLQGIVATLAERQQSEKILRLEAENKRLRGEMVRQRTELAEMRKSIDSLRRVSRHPSLLSPLPPRGIKEIMGDKAIFVPPPPPSLPDLRQLRDASSLSGLSVRH